VVSTIGSAINSIISAIAAVLETIIGAIVSVRTFVDLSSACHLNLFITGNCGDIHNYYGHSMLSLLRKRWKKPLFYAHQRQS
jgi:hypothetical protein